MTTAALKRKIKALVDKETNDRKLDNVLAFFETVAPSAAQRADIKAAIAASEADFKAGRYVNGTEARRQAKVALKGKRAA